MGTSQGRSRLELEKKDLIITLRRLRQCLPLAALACILRPTNILIWMSLSSVALFRGSWATRMVLVREVVLCG